MADGFLGRWARRKQEVREGRPLEEPAPAVLVRVEPMRAAVPVAPLPTRDTAVEVAPVQAQPESGPSLEDVKTLTPESDFTPFVARGVQPEVKNAAMKKLFADPHFNVMDGLDIYIDDYSKPDPLPLPMLRKMASAQFLGLVEEEKKPTAASAALSDNPTQPAATTPIAPEPTTPDVVESATERQETEHHADPDLRLQQDHAAGPQGSGGGAQ